MKEIRDKTSCIAGGNAFAAVLALLGTGALAYLLESMHGAVFYGFEYLAVFLTELYCFKRLAPRFKGFAVPRFGIFAFLFVLGCFAAADLDTRGSFLLAKPVISAIALLSLTVSVIVVLEKLEALFCGAFSNRGMEASAGDGRVFVKYMLFIFACWLPVLLAYFPGLFNYDVYGQIPQGTLHMYNTSHPLVHTLLLYGFYDLGRVLGSYNTGFLLYTLFQMLVLSAAFAWLMLYLYRCGISKKARISVLLLICFIPFVSMLAISATKDVIFAGFFLVVCVCICMFFDEGQPRGTKSVYFAAAVGLCLFRSYEKFALILFAAICFFLGKEKRRLAGLTVAALVAAVLINQALVLATDAVGGSPNEMLSVPYQQLSRVAVVRADELSQEELTELYNVVPDYAGYRESISDPVKYTGRFLHSPVSSLRTYVKFFLRYPGEYVSAFAHLTRGYWDISDISHAEQYGTEQRQGYLLSDTKEGFGIEHRTLFPALENLYEKLFTENKYQDIPVISLLFSPALYTWLILALLLFGLGCNNSRVFLIPFFFVLSYMLGLLLGPCCLIRYAFPYIICIPALCCVNFRQTEN